MGYNSVVHFKEFGSRGAIELETLSSRDLIAILEDSIDDLAGCEEREREREK